MGYQLVVTLAQDIQTCTACPLHTLRATCRDGCQRDHVAVPAEVGDLYRPGGGLAIMCEAPGADETHKGRPLVGRAGDNLNAMLAMAGINRAELLLLNRVRCRPPRNRIDRWTEAVANCDRWTVRELEEYAPAVVVLMGNTAMRAVFGAEAAVTRTRGQLLMTGPVHEWGARAWAVTFHPAATLYNHDEDLLWQIAHDLQAAKALLDWTLPF